MTIRFTVTWLIVLVRVITVDRIDLFENHHHQSSSSSCRATSTNIHDPLSPLLPMVHRFWQVLRATSRILKEQLYVGSSGWPAFARPYLRGLSVLLQIIDKYILIKPIASSAEGAEGVVSGNTLNCLWCWNFYSGDKRPVESFSIPFLIGHL